MVSLRPTAMSIVAALTLAVCGGASAPAAVPAASGAASIVLSEVWAITTPDVASPTPYVPVDPMNPPMPGASTAPMMSIGDGMDTVLYMTVRNTGTTAERLVGASSELASSAQLHIPNMDGSMRVLPAIELPVGRTALMPGGFHVMFFGLTRSLRVGDEFTATLRFEQAGSVAVRAPVRSR